MSRLSLARFTPLLMLYGSRLAGVLVSVLFIPLFARLLGPEQFGLVALILSAQAMLIMLDLGMSALIGRDIAAAPSDSNLGLRNWLQAERLLSRAMLGLAALALAVTAFWVPHRLLELAMALMLFWALLLQNLAQAAMIAKRDFQRAGTIQIAGVLARALTTAAALSLGTASLGVFLLSQMLGALVHLAINRQACRTALSAAQSGPLTATATAAEPLLQLARRGFPLFVMGLAGAAVLQLDKPIVGAFMGPTAVSSYFLATTFCMAPIAILAAPVAQFFLPQIVHSCSSEDRAALLRKTRQLTFALMLTVVLPSCLIWAWRDSLIMLWLRDETLATKVAEFSTIMLPAAAIGAVGNVPLALLSALQDFKFQARLGPALTLSTLAGVAFAAGQNDLRGVCWAYLAYYAILTAALWLRAATRDKTARAARSSAAIATVVCVAATAPLALLRPQ